MKGRFLGAVFGGLTLLFAACDTADDENVFNVGVVMPVTGTLAGAGTEVIRGMELARDEINDSGRLGGTTLGFITADNASDTDKTVAAYRQLVDMDQTKVLLAPLTSSSTATIVDLAAVDSVVLFSPTSSASGLSARSPWLFRSSLTIENLVPVGVATTRRQLGYQDVAAIVNDGDVFSLGSHDKIIDELETEGFVVFKSVQSYTRPPGEAVGDLTPQLTEIMNADPEVIFLSGLPEDQYGVITQGHALGITDVPYIATLFAIADVRRINAAVPGAAEGAVTFQVWLASSENRLSQAFVDNYRARHGEVPGDFAARGYAAVYILAEALSKASNYEAASVRDALAAIRNLDTIYGSFSFDEHGDAIYEPIVAQVRENEFVILP